MKINFLEAKKHILKVMKSMQAGMPIDTHAAIGAHGIPAGNVDAVNSAVIAGLHKQNVSRSFIIIFS